MPRTINFYIDDSGTRNPDRHPGAALPAHGYDYFGFGGVMLDSDDEEPVRNRHAAFVEKWEISAPLHSHEIRSKRGGFAFIGGLSTRAHGEFFSDLSSLVTSKELTALACCVDRPGYNARYRGKYGRRRWRLCKTAFHILVERAAKYARSRNAKLRVLAEQCGKREDRDLKAYFEAMRTSGHPFDQERSSSYAPLDAISLSETLYEFRTKLKSSPLVQLADLVLWPICVGGYHPDNRPYRTLLESCTLLDARLTDAERETLGTKYSCFEQVRLKKD